MVSQVKSGPNSETEESMSPRSALVTPEHGKAIDCPSLIMANRERQ